MGNSPAKGLFATHLENLCFMAIQPECLVPDSAGDYFRITFARAYAENPALFLKVLTRVRVFYKRRSQIWKAMRFRQRFQFKDGYGHDVVKLLEEMSTKDMQCFLEQETGKPVEWDAIYKCRSRLLAEDRASWQATVDRICTYFHGDLRRLIRRRLLKDR
jgi:hypothetical protein